MVERKRGRAGQEQRRRRLKLHPVCAECLKRGIVRATKIIDHIRPLALGGSDEDENTQGLCLLCNAIKTATENASAGGAANWPFWLNPSAVPLEIVCGPPFAGKRDYVFERAGEGDVVVDFEVILKRFDPQWSPWRGTTAPDLFNRAIRARNSMLGSLCRLPHSSCRAFFIIAAPTLGERQWWERTLIGDVVLLHPGVEECKRRASVFGPAAVAGVDRWTLQSRLSWSLPKAKLAKVGVGDDGYPLEG